MTRLSLPKWVKDHNYQYDGVEEIPQVLFERVKRDMMKFHHTNPEVSIVIPAYNEEKHLLRTLSSLSKLNTKYSVEIIVVNNGSTDRTQELIDKCGVRSIYLFPNKGVAGARQAGLEIARGKYILNADSDGIYPSTWVDPFIEALKDPAVSCTYSGYSFVPSKHSTRASLAVHEMLSGVLVKIKTRTMEYVNVMGFNFAFRKEDAIKVGGFNMNLDREKTGRSDDGWMALCLSKIGKIKMMDNHVWTSDRRLVADGGTFPAIIKRVKKEIMRLGRYKTPHQKMVVE